MSEIRKKFGLDFLDDTPSKNESSSGESLDRKILVTLKKLKDSDTYPAELSMLVDATGESRDSIWPVVETLEKLLTLVRTDKDRYGNHKVWITDRGEEYLKSVTQ